MEEGRGGRGNRGGRGSWGPRQQGGGDGGGWRAAGDAQGQRDGDRQGAPRGGDGGWRGGRGGGGGGWRGGERRDGDRGDERGQSRTYNGGRPMGGGGVGKHLLSNIFKIDLRPGQVIHQYGVSMTPGKGTDDRRLRSRGFRQAVAAELLKGVENWSWAFTGTNIISPKPIALLDDKAPRVVSLKSERGTTSNVNLAVTSYDALTYSGTSKTQFLNCLNTALRLALSFAGYEMSMGKYLVKHIVPEDDRMARNLADVEIWRGFTAAIGDSPKGPFVVHEVSHKIVNKQTVGQLIRKSKDPSRPEAALRNHINSACQFHPLYDPNRSYRLIGVEVKDIDAPMDPTSESRMTLREYYIEKFSRPSNGRKGTEYNTEFKRTIERMTGRTPLLVARRDGNNCFMFPDFCSFTELTTQIRQCLPRVCGLKPLERASFALDMFRHFSAKKDPAGLCPIDVIHKWGVKVSPIPISPSYSNLDKVSLRLFGNDRPFVSRGPFDIRDNVKGAHGRYSVSSDAQAIRPIVIFEGRVERMKEDFMRPLNSSFANWGVDCDLTKCNHIRIPADRDLNTFFDGALKGGINLVVVFLDSFNNAYESVKKVLLKRRIVSQAVNAGTQERLSSQRAMICDSLVVQILAKFGCPVWLPDPLGSLVPSSPINNSKVDLLVVSMDVYHAGMIYTKGGDERQDPSVAGFCGMWMRNQSVDGKLVPTAKYFGMVARHAARQEISKAAGKGKMDGKAEHSAYARFLESIFKTCNETPAVLVVLRDGTAASQDDLLERNELSQVKDTVKKYSKGKSCNITFTMCVKRISQMFVSSSSGAEDFNIDNLESTNINNAPAGIIVDDERIVADKTREFFLFSLGTSPATARAVHYRCLELGIPLKELEELCFKLSHVFYTWPGPVLVPGPVQYAHTAANLAAEVFDKTEKDMGPMHTGLIYL